MLCRMATNGRKYDEYDWMFRRHKMLMTRIEKKLSAADEIVEVYFIGHVQWRQFPAHTPEARLTYRIWEIGNISTC